MITEIDTRFIPGNGGAIVWWLGDNDQHFVRVFGPNDEIVTTLHPAGPLEAREAFYHPFARADVPDVFKAERDDT